MSNFVEAGKTSEYKDGTKKKLLIQGNEIMLVRVRDKYYAIDNRCPHRGGNLAEGKLEGTIITCPLHASQFDITDGHNVRWLKSSGVVSSIGKVLKSPQSVRTYEVKIEGDAIMVEI